MKPGLRSVSIFPRASKNDEPRKNSMAEFKVVGAPIPRLEGPDKVSGRTIYAADVNLPGALWGKILRSPHPRARIRRIDVSRARQVPSVRAVITGPQISGHLIGKQIRDMPVLCWEVVRFVGDRVAAVAADTQEAAEEAVGLIDVDYEELRAVFEALGLSEDRIRVNVVNVGGEFGGKGDGIDLPIAYFLARESGRPVKIVMNYAEELTASNPAHPTVITIRSGVKPDGRIVARSLRAVHASGAYGALKANSSLATWHYAGGQYRVDNACLEFLQIYTNTVPGGYYRSPGAVATAFAIDSHTDIIAEELGMDPAEFRLRNFIGEGEEDAVGHRLRDVRFREVLQAALRAADWKKPKRLNCGRGIALSGRHISGGDTGVILTAEPDGTFTVLSPTIDQGSGTHTILRQLVAEQMKVPMEEVRVLIGDTDTTPRDSGVRASRVTYVAGNAVMQACGKLREQLLRHAARRLECGADEIEFDGGKFWVRQDCGQQITLLRVVTQASEAR